MVHNSMVGIKNYFKGDDNKFITTFPNKFFFSEIRERTNKGYFR